MSDGREGDRAAGAPGFLNRWSRRKRGAVEAQPAPEAAPNQVPLPEFDPASLPPIESLTAESNIAAFLRPQVPAALRTAALRRAWMLDPAIRDYVGPADYAWDFNAEQGMAGFSLELGGDVKRLLAQAIGLVEEAAEKPAEAPGADAAMATEADSAPSPGAVSAMSPGAGLPTSTGVVSPMLPRAVLPVAPGAVSPTADPAPEAPPGLVAEAPPRPVEPAPAPIEAVPRAAAAAPQARRHGGARPT